MDTIVQNGLEGRLAALPEEWRNLVLYYSGNRPDGTIVLLEILENIHRQLPHVPLLSIQRKPSYRGRTGGILEVSCGLCPKTGRLYQKIAEHLISEHWNLSLWHCEFPGCLIACRRHFDLHRHHEIHDIERPWKVKGLGKHRRASTISTYDNHISTRFPSTPFRRETIPSPQLQYISLVEANNRRDPVEGDNIVPQMPTMEAPITIDLHHDSTAASSPYTPIRNPPSRLRIPMTTGDGYLCVPSAYPSRSRRASHSSSSSDQTGPSGSDYDTYTSPSSPSNSPMQPWGSPIGSPRPSFPSSEIPVPGGSPFSQAWSPLQDPTSTLVNSMHRSGISTTANTSPWSTYDSDILSSPMPSPYSACSGMSLSPIIPSANPYQQYNLFPTQDDMRATSSGPSSYEGDRGAATMTQGLGLYTLNTSESEKGFNFGVRVNGLDDHNHSTMNQVGPNIDLEGGSSKG